MAPLRNYVEERAKISKAGLLVLADLNYELRIVGLRFLLFAILFYFGIPIIYYWLNLGWSVIDSFYFCAVTFSTVGYGDILPTGIDQRMITTAFIIVGTGVTANLVGVCATIFLQQPEYAYDSDNGEEHNIPRSLQNSGSFSLANAIPNAQRPAPAVTTEAELEMSAIDRCCIACRKLFDWCTGYEEIALVNGTTVFQASASTRTKNKVSQGLRPSCVSYGGEGSKNNSIAVNRIRKVIRQYHLDMQDIRFGLFVNFIVLWVIVVIGTFSMVSIESFRPADAFYWAVITVTTVGYGDVVPVTNGGKVFTIFYIAIGTIMMGITLSDIILTPISLRAKKNEIIVLQQFERNLDEHQLDTLLDNKFLKSIPQFYQKKNELTKSEFMLTILQMMSKVNESDLLMASEVYDRYGTLSHDAMDISPVLKFQDLEGHLQQAKEFAERERQRKQSNQPTIENTQRNTLSGRLSEKISFHSKLEQTKSAAVLDEPVDNILLNERPSQV